MDMKHKAQSMICVKAIAELNALQKMARFINFPAESWRPTRMAIGFTVPFPSIFGHGCQFSMIVDPQAVIELCSYSAHSF